MLEGRHWLNSMISPSYLQGNRMSAHSSEQMCMSVVTYPEIFVVTTQIKNHMKRLPIK